MTKWLEIIQEYPDNVIHWEAKKKPKTVLRETRSYDGKTMSSTVVDEELDESVEEPVIEDQDVVVKINDPDESMIEEHKSITPRSAEPFQPTVSGWYDLAEDKPTGPYTEDRSLHPYQ